MSVKLTSEPQASIVSYGVKEVASSRLGDEQKLDIKAIYMGVDRVKIFCQFGHDILYQFFFLLYVLNLVFESV